jgi:hypothetical protein
MARIFFVLRRPHFSYHTSTIEALVRRGADVHLFVDDGKEDAVRDVDPFATWIARNPHIPHQPLLLRRDFLRKPLMFFRELRTYGAYCNRSDDFTFYRERWSKYMKAPPPLRRWLISRSGRAVAGSRATRMLASAVEFCAPPSRTIRDWLKAAGPSVVVVSPGNLRHSEDVEVLKASRNLGIRTIVPILTWDNTTIKGLFHIQPDQFLAWNDAHAEELMHYHGVDSDRIRITGSPFFDKWFDIKEPVEPRQAFQQRVGLNPERPFVLYLGSSANIAQDETWFVRELGAAFARHPDIRAREMQILFRPHPANWQIGLPLPDAGIPMWPRQGSLPDDDAAFADFRASLEHADCVVGLNTSGMLDAIIYGKPVISPLIESYQFTQARAQHFTTMLEANALYTTASADGVADQLSAILRGHDPLRANRTAFVRRFVRPSDVSAGEAQAEAILSSA